MTKFISIKDYLLYYYVPIQDLAKPMQFNNIP